MYRCFPVKSEEKMKNTIQTTSENGNTGYISIHIMVTVHFI